MASYAFAHRGAALPYGNGNGITVLKRNVDLPALIASPGKLSLPASPSLPLSAFTGFVQNDILELFEVPAGTLILDMGVRCSTAEGATAAAEMGYNSATQTALGIAGSAADPDGYFNAVDLNSATVQSESKLEIAGTGVGMLDIFVTAGSIDIKFTTNDTYAVAIFDVWALACGPVF